MQRGYLSQSYGDPKGESKFFQQQLAEREAQIKGLQKELEYVSKQASYNRQMSTQEGFNTFG